MSCVEKAQLFVQCGKQRAKGRYIQMSRIAIVKKKKEKYVHIKLSGNEMINTREIELLNSHQINSLIDPETGKKNKSELFYKVSNYISLKEYLKSVTSKDRFLNIIISILETLKDTQKVMLYNKNFILDTEYIFVEPQSKMLLYIYLPVVNYDFEQDIKRFFMNIVYDTVFNQFEDCTYVSQYIAYFNQHTNFSVFDFEMFVRELNGEDMRSGDKKVELKLPHPSKFLDSNVKLCPRCGKEYTNVDNFCDVCGIRLVYKDSDTSFSSFSSGSSNFMYATPVEEEIEQVQNGTQQMTLSDRIGSINQNSNIGGKPYVPQYSKGTTVLGAIDYGTTVLSFEQLNRIAYPSLLRTKDGKKITVNKCTFVIGKSEANCDYVISDNNAISRKHATISIANGKYYVVDNSSTNGTYIDDIRIDADKSYEILPGQKIRFADDEFTLLDVEH